MTKTIYKTEHPNANPTSHSHRENIDCEAPCGHTKFGGVLTLFDFDGHHTLASMARKIASDQAFDRQCQKNIEFRNREKQE